MKKYKSVSEILDELEVKDAWYVDLYYWFVRKIEYIRDIPREIKWFIQRGKRGYSDQDVWGLHYYLSSILSGALKDLKTQAHGYPGILYKQHRSDFVYNKTEDEEGFNEWLSILGKMIKTFETAKLVDDHKLRLVSSEEYTDDWYNTTLKHCNEMRQERAEWDSRPMTLDEIKEYEEGWRLFQKYYFNLWD